jgi:signal peptidase II
MRKKDLLSLVIIGAVFFFDQAAKYLARTRIGTYENISLMPFLNLVNVENKGAAFGMFRSLGNAFFIVISITALVVMVWLILKDKEDFRIVSLLAGGAMGNLTDRLFLGHVVDFIDFTVSGYHWPAFNVADSALSVGMVLLCVSMLRKKS